jgi:hypothetical protein
MEVFLERSRRYGALMNSLRDSRFSLNRHAVSFSAKRAPFPANHIQPAKSAALG